MTNASNLTAAAPDLLVELKEALSALEEFARYSDQMSKIGRGYGFTGDRYGRQLEGMMLGARKAIAKAEGGTS